MVCCSDHALFYCLDIVITNNKRDRLGNCTNGQDLGRCNEVSDRRGNNSIGAEEVGGTFANTLRKLQRVDWS
jgi:hypothetical protein